MKFPLLQDLSNSFKGHMWLIPYLLYHLIAVVDFDHSNYQEVPKDANFYFFFAWSTEGIGFVSKNHIFYLKKELAEELQ